MKIKYNETFWLKAMQWATSFSYYAIFDSNNYTHDQYARYDSIIACGNLEIFSAENYSFQQIDTWLQSHGKWVFGHLNYDMKNEFENLQSAKPQAIPFPAFSFFVPQYILLHQHDEIDIINYIPFDIQVVENVKLRGKKAHSKDITFHPKQTQSQYHEAIELLHQHIIEGDIYEINYCTNLISKNVTIDTLSTYETLKSNTRAPFSVLYHQQNNTLICGSPERFAQKQGDTIISQPIKGTIKKGNTEQENGMLIKQLQTNPKERAENVMIVDLVRNDLNKICKSSTVHVPELCAVYTFQTVHQLISTVKGILQNHISFYECMKALFPMGSMTGAPKVSAMQLIEKYECFQRGLFSGSIGYIQPNGDFDFNVVIRSILYNSQLRTAQIAVGSAITHYANAHDEYNECILKAEALLKTLNATIQHHE